MSILVFLTYNPLICPALPSSIGCAPTAQAAAQQGAYLGRLFRDNLSLFDSDKLKAKDAPPLPPSVLPFQYKHKGSLAYVGGNEGVAELKKLIWVGYPPFR